MVYEVKVSLDIKGEGRRDFTMVLCCMDIMNE